MRPAISISLSKWPMLPTMALFFIFAMSAACQTGPEQKSTTQAPTRASMGQGHCRPRGKARDQRAPSARSPPLDRRQLPPQPGDSCPLPARPAHV